MGGLRGIQGGCPKETLNFLNCVFCRLWLSGDDDQCADLP